MASTRALKSRIRSVKSTRQITKAMQLVAASKMRRAQEATKATEPYTRAAREILSDLAGHTSVKSHPLFTKRSVKSRLVILVASDKGLAGAYNTNVLRAYTDLLKTDVAAKVRTSTITIGRKAALFVARLKDVEVLAAYEDLPDKPDGSEVRSILETARQDFEAGKIDAVDVIYTNFVSSIAQIPKVVRVLPAGDAVDPVPSLIVEDFSYEPSASEVLDGIAYRLVEAQIFQALLDARASEHSMRMMAMKNATDNASDLVSDLTLEMNKARQAAITQELAEISGGVQALSE
jgi:F-type H+-transporting ATPase subunit gamma